MLYNAKWIYIVFWDADWYRYLWIFKGLGGADLAGFWQDYQGLISI
jgi:hypothetical protein